ncbi:MAG: ABC transporter permease [Chloroflexota bacterium]|nr:ABC transporter permease [Chloroflexota bacterium]
MRIFFNLFIAHYKQFIRDKAALFFTFLFPILFILVFGWAFGDPSQSFDVGVVTQDTSDIAYAVVAALNEVEVLDDIEVGDFNTEMDLLRDGDLEAVIVIPEGFGDSLQMGQAASLDVHYDPSQTSTVQILLPLLEQVMDGIERGITGNIRLISLEEHIVQSRELKMIDYLVPGILGMSIMFSGIFACIPIIQQRQAQIIKRLGCTPLRRSSLVLSELAFRMILVLLTTALIVLVGRLAFGVEMVGNWGVLCGLCILGTLAFVSIGYVIAAFVRTEESAIPIINVINFPMMFLSGTFFPVSNMPGFIEPIVSAIPLTYLTDALRQTMVDSTPFHPMTTNVLVLTGWLVVCLLITIRFFRWD